MKLRRWLRRSEKGQATLEFLIVFPLLFSLFLLALAAAAVWSGHHLSSAVSLEGASRESVQSGSGSSFVSGTGNSVSANTDFSTEVADFANVEWPSAGQTVHSVRNRRGPLGSAGFGLERECEGNDVLPNWEFWGKSAGDERQGSQA